MSDQSRWALPGATPFERNVLKQAIMMRRAELDERAEEQGGLDKVDQAERDALERIYVRPAVREEVTFDTLVFQTIEGGSEQLFRKLEGVDEEAARIYAEAWTQPPTPGKPDSFAWDIAPRIMECRAVVMKNVRTLVVQMRGDRDGRTVDEGDR